MQPLCDDYFRQLEEQRQRSPAATNAVVRAYLEAARTHLLGRHDARAPARSVNEARRPDRPPGSEAVPAGGDAYFEENPRLQLRIAVVAVGGTAGASSPSPRTSTCCSCTRQVEPVVSGSPSRSRTACGTLACTGPGRARSPLHARGPTTSPRSPRSGRALLIGDPGLFAELEARGAPRAARADAAGFRAQARGAAPPQALRRVRTCCSRMCASGRGLRDYHRRSGSRARCSGRCGARACSCDFIDGQELEELVAALDLSCGACATGCTGRYGTTACTSTRRASSPSARLPG
jgi:hypothetical protein